MMARVFCVLGALLLCGLVQADVIGRNAEPTEIEDLRSAGSRIVAGWPAQEGQIPHQISLRMVSTVGGVSSCGGSIIHNNWVITAAHCVANRISFVIRFGLISLTQPDVITETTRKYIHPGYIEASAGVQTHDIALLGLDQFINYGPTIQPCRLQNSENKNMNYEGKRFTVSGFGRTDDLWNGGTTSEILLWTYLLGITNEECRTWYPSSTVIQNETICAAYYNDTAQSSCQGDSGGPLTIVDVDGNPTMVGIVSFGSSAGCNSPFPSAYVRPGHYLEWILEVTGIDFDWKQSDLDRNSNESNDSSNESNDSSNQGSNESNQSSNESNQGSNESNQGSNESNQGSNESNSEREEENYRGHVNIVDSPSVL